MPAGSVRDTGEITADIVGSKLKLQRFIDLIQGMV